MGQAGDRAVDKLSDAFRVFVVGIVIIYMGYQITKPMLAELPLWIKIVISGLLFFFVYIVRNSIKEFVSKILKTKR